MTSGESRTNSEAEIEYRLIALTWEKTIKIDITEIEFQEIYKSIEILRFIFDIEEAFDSIMENYREYEECQMRATLDHALDTAGDPDETDDVRRKSARRLDNLLSSIRAFLDITPSRVKQIGGSGMMKEFKEICSAEYDSNEAYRFMEALRNYSQHDGKSINGMKFNWKMVNNNESTEFNESQVVYSVQSRIDAETLRPHFKRHHLANIDRIQDESGFIYLTPLVRSYIAGLNKVILGARHLVKELEQLSLDINRKSAERLYEAGCPRQGHLKSIAKYRFGQKIEDEYLATRQDHRIKRLRRRNGKVIHLPRVQLSG